MSGLTQREVRALFIAACRAELDALKPGNVHVHAAGHGMEAEQFTASAKAAAPWIADASLAVGERILRAVEASLAAAGCNTNLGILLLAAPLAAAAEKAEPGGLHNSLRHVLGSLDDADAEAVFSAIRRANPGGLGSVADQDVASAPRAGLREAMSLAADRDRIAQAYVTDFAEVFDFGLPRFQLIRRQTADRSIAVTTLHMAYLAAFADSHIARKFGASAAEEVRTAAQSLKSQWQPVARTDTLKDLMHFDSKLKARQLNPGTTADFVVATLFAADICDRLSPPKRL
jgi:triphosphoribosyl-dephospho-CoA synthase